MSVDRSMRRAVARGPVPFLLGVIALLLFRVPAHGQAITLLSPNGGERYELAQPVTVVWTAQEVSAVRIDYSSDNGNTWTTVAPSVAAGAGRYTFTPYPLPTRTALVRVVDLARPQIYDRSERFFEIMEPKSIIVYTPTGGERILRGSTIMVSWDAPRVEAVDLFYSVDGGVNWIPLASGIRAFNWSYEWKLPDRVIRNVKVRVQEVGGSVYGESGVFEIVDPDPSGLVVQYPNGGEKFIVGDSITVRWIATGLTGTVDISYSTDLGGTWQLLRAGVPAINNALGWRIATPPGARYLVRVQSSGGLVDVSDGPFEVVRRLAPAITLLFPNGGEKFIVGELGTIIWTMTDLTQSVTVEYSVDSGRSWKGITTATPKDGQTLFTWGVPDDTTAHALIRVFNAEGGDTSDAFFSILRPSLPPLIVLTPNGGEIWRAGERRTIRWTALPSITAVDVYLSIDGGAHWQQIAANVPTAASGSVDWVIPSVGERGAGTSSARVRVQNHGSALENDLSDSTFTINTDRTTLGVDERGGGMGGFSVLGLSPNPSPGRAELRWRQGRAGDVELRLYRSGGAVAGLFDLGRRDAGEHGCRIDASLLPNGVYLYELRSPGMVAHGTLVIAR